MHLVDCTISLPPTLGAMLLTLGQLAEFCVLINGKQGLVTLIYGERKKRRMPGAVPGGGGEGAKPVAL